MSYYINMSVEKQICVNRVDIPAELLDIIKSYAFTDMITYLAKMRKNTIHTLIQCTHFSGQYKKSSRRFIFLIEEDQSCPQYQMLFCTKCGNYITYKSINEKVNCLC